MEAPEESGAFIVSAARSRLFRADHARQNRVTRSFGDGARFAVVFGRAELDLTAEKCGT
jgi:hypothetical protein